MRRILALLLVLTMLPLAGAQADAATVKFTAASKSGVTHFVDLTTDKGDLIRFEANDAAFSAVPATVIFRLDCTCSGVEESLEFTGARSGGVAKASLPVNTRDLVAGSWQVRATGLDNTGATQTLGPHTLVVTANDSDAPVLSIPGLDDDTNTVDVGAGQSVRVDVDEPLIRKVSYQLDGMPAPFELPFPYSIAASSFNTGEQGLIITATDRAGHESRLSVRVYADDILPVVNFTIPSILYLDVPNPLPFTILEDSNFTVTSQIGGAASTFEGDGAPLTQSLKASITPDTMGFNALEIRVEDRLRNVVTFTQNVEVRTLESDLKLVSARVTGGPVLPTQTQTLHIEATQAVSPVTITVDVLYGGRVVGQIDLEPKGNETDTSIPMQFRPGQHNLELRLRVPEGVLELNDTDDALTIPVEVYAGRVMYGDAIFHIRANSLGVPVEAVDSAGRTYTLTAQDQGLGVVYAFRALDVDLHWDPNQLITTFDVEEEEPEDEGIPGFAVAPLLAFAFLLRRRK